MKRGEFNLNAETPIQSAISGPREISLVRPPGSSVGVQPVLDSDSTPSLTSGLQTPDSSRTVHVNVLSRGVEGHEHSMMAFNPMLDGSARELQQPVFTG